MPKIKGKDKGINLKYCDYNLTTIIDSRGGFLVESVDSQPISDPKVSHEPPLNLLDPSQRCTECQSIDISPEYLQHYKVCVCRECIKTNTNYALLTKTEVRQDYLLTESELKDVLQLPHWIRPNPHSQTYSNMLLYLKCQVESFAIRKWGSLEKLDEEFEKREAEKEARKKMKFKKKTLELRQKTLISKGSSFKEEKRHVHSFENPRDVGNGIMSQRCNECGLEREFENI